MEDSILICCMFVLFVALIPPKTETAICASCSSADDPSCPTANYDANSKECYGANPCAVAIVMATGHTYRGCASDAECYDNELCETCDGDGCNNGAYPDNRTSCVRCSATDAGCQELVDPTQYSASCVLYFQDGACATVFNGYKLLKRGCLADLGLTETVDSCNKQSAECVICGEDNCNVVNVRPDEQCLQCDSQDRGCTDGSHAVSGCAKVSEGKCFSRLLNGTMNRGCFHELSAEESASCNSTSCIICAGPGCNNGTLTVRTNHSPQFEAPFKLLVLIICIAQTVF